MMPNRNINKRQIMERWPDGTIKSQNNAFSMTSGRSVIAQYANSLLLSQSASKAREARSNDTVERVNKAKRKIDLAPANFHVYSKAKK